MRRAPSYLGRYPQIHAPVIFSQDVLQRLPTQAALSDSNSTLEFEVRLGRLTKVNRFETFQAGVSSEFFHEILGKLNGYPSWHSVTPWVESHDFYHELAPSPEDLNDKNILVRSTTESTGDGTGKESEEKPIKCTHVCKHIHSKCDYRFVQTGPLPHRTPTYDIRIGVNFEEQVPAEVLPPAVNNLTRVRIKTRKRFVHQPKECTKPMWAFDLTMSWTGKTLEEAEQRQRKKDTCYEVEIECLDVYGYLEMPGKDAWLLATSMLLKVCDFVGNDVPFKWDPLLNVQAVARYQR